MRNTLKWGLVGVAGILALNLVGCTSPQATPTGSQAQSDNVQIRWAQYGNSIDDPSGMANDPIKKAVEEATNLTIQYDTGGEGFDERMITELATGSGPDIFSTWGESEKIQAWIADEAVIDLNAIVSAQPDRYPLLNKMFTSPEYKAYSELYSGDANKVYAIYAVSALPHPSFQGVPVYNQALLDEFNGGKVPTTVEEFITFTTAVGKSGTAAGWWPRNDKLTNWGPIDKTIALPQGTSIAPPADQPWTGFNLVGDD